MKNPLYYMSFYQKKKKIRKILHAKLYLKVRHNTWWLNGKFACQAEDTGLIPRSGRSRGKGNGNLL